MNKEEKKLAHKFGFDWVKIHPKNLACYTTVGKYDIAKEIRFYLEYIPKFVKYSIRNFKQEWLNFLLKEKETLVIKNYSEMNKKLNERHGNFNKNNDIFFGGITKALEIDTVTASRILKLGKDENELFKREVKSRTEPYIHLANKQDYKQDYEKQIAEKQKELEGKGLGDIVAIKGEGDDRRREEEERT